MSTITQVQSFGEELKKSLQCAICLGLLSNPQSAECLHKFCRICIETHLKGKKKARCPICKMYISKRSMRDASELNEIVHKVQNVLNSINTDGKQIADNTEPLIVFSQQSPRTPVRKTATRKWDTDKKKKKGGCPNERDEEEKKNLIKALEKGKLGSYKGRKKASEVTQQTSKEKSGAKRAQISEIDKTLAQDIRTSEENVPQERRTRKDSHEMIEKLKKGRTASSSSEITSPILSSSLFNNKSALEAKNRAMQRLKAISLTIESSGKDTKSPPITPKPPSKSSRSKDSLNTPKSTANLLLKKKNSPFSMKTPAKPTSTVSSQYSKDSPVGERRSKRAKIRPAIIEDDDDSQQNFVPPVQDSVTIALEDLSTSFDLDQPRVHIINSRLKRRRKKSSPVKSKKEIMISNDVVKNVDKIINISKRHSSPESKDTQDIHNNDTGGASGDAVNSNDEDDGYNDENDYYNDVSDDDDDLPSCGVFDSGLSKESESMITLTESSNNTQLRMENEAWAGEIELKSSVDNIEAESSDVIEKSEKQSSIPIELLRGKDISICTVLETPLLKPDFHDEPNFSPITPLTTSSGSDLHCITPVFTTPNNTILETPIVLVNTVAETPIQTTLDKNKDTFVKKLLSRKRNKKSFSESECKKQRVLETPHQKLVSDTVEENEFIVSGSTTSPPIPSFEGLINVTSPEIKTNLDSPVEQFGVAFDNLACSPVFGINKRDNGEDTPHCPVVSVADNGEDSQDSQNKLSNFVKCIELEKSSNLPVRCRTVTSGNKTRGTVVEKVFEKTEKTSPTLTIKKDENSINYTIEIENPSSKLTIHQEGEEILSPKLMKSIYDDITNHGIPSVSNANQPTTIRHHSMIQGDKLTNQSPTKHTEDCPKTYNVPKDGPKTESVSSFGKSVSKLSLQESNSLDNCATDESHFDLVEYKKTFGIQDSNLCDETKLTHLNLLNQDSITTVMDSQEDDSLVKPENDHEPKPVEQSSPKADSNTFKSPHTHITMVTESIQPGLETPSNFKRPLSASTQHKESDGSETKSPGVTTQDMMKIEKELLGLFSLVTRDESDELGENDEEKGNKIEDYHDPCLGDKELARISDNVTAIELIEDTLPQHHSIEGSHQNTNIITEEMNDNIHDSIFPEKEKQDHSEDNQSGARHNGNKAFPRRKLFELNDIDSEDVIENIGELQLDHDESSTQIELFGVNAPLRCEDSSSKVKTCDTKPTNHRAGNGSCDTKPSSHGARLNSVVLKEANHYNKENNESSTQVELFGHPTDQLSEVKNISETPISKSIPPSASLTDAQIQDITIEECVDNKENLPKTPLPCLDNNKKSSCSVAVSDNSVSLPLVTERSPIIPARRKSHLVRNKPPQPKTINILLSGGHHSDNMKIIYTMYHLMKSSSISLSIMTTWSDSVTHIVFPHNEHLTCLRTTKYLQGVAAGKWIISLEWARQCLETKSLISEIPFEMRGDNFDPCSGGPRNSRTSRILKQPLLFSNLIVFYVGKIKTLSKEVLSQLLEQVGITITPTQTFGTTQLTNTIKSTPLIDTNITSVSSVTKEYGEVLTVQWLLDCIAAYRVLPIDSSQSSECG